MIGRNEFGRPISGWVAGLAFLLGLAVSIPTTAVADDDREVSDETARKVLKLLKSGKKAYDAEDYETAYDKFERAYELWERPAIQARLGKAAEQMGDNEKALEHYRAYLEAKPDGKMADDIRENLDALAKKTPATLDLRSDPSGASVYLGTDTDGEKLGTTPLETEVEPGTKTFTITADGYEPTTRTWDLKAGTTEESSVQLMEKTEPQAFDRTTSPAETETDTSGGGLSTGTLGWTVGGAGVAGLAAGTVFTLLKGQRAREARALGRETSRSEFRQKKRAALGHYRRSLVAFSIGGSLTAVGVGLLLNHYLSNGSAETASVGSRIRVDVGWSSRGGWAGLRGNF